MKRCKTDYPGVFYREVERIGGTGLEKVFYVVFKQNGKVYEEKVGRQYADDMTPARAARIRGSASRESGSPAKKLGPKRRHRNKQRPNAGPSTGYGRNTRPTDSLRAWPRTGADSSTTLNQPGGTKSLTKLCPWRLTGYDCES